MPANENDATEITMNTHTRTVTHTYVWVPADSLAAGDIINTSRGDRLVTDVRPHVDYDDMVTVTFESGHEIPYRNDDMVNVATEA